MYNTGVTTGKDFFLITQRHLPFLFNEKYQYANYKIYNIHYGKYEKHSSQISAQKCSSTTSRVSP
jgi:hypothetical protein